MGDKIVDVDYIDCGLLRGKLEEFISSPYLNLSNPWLVKVNYIHAMTVSFTPPVLYPLSD